MKPLPILSMSVRSHEKEKLSPGDFSDVAGTMAVLFNGWVGKLTPDAAKVTAACCLTGLKVKYSHNYVSVVPLLY